MPRTLGLFALLLSVSVVSAAAPEELLPASTQLYARWDGGTALPDAYAKTAIGKLYAGETGKMREALIASVLKLIPADPKAQEVWTKYQPLLDTVYRQGFLVALDVKQVSPPVVTLSIIVPNAPAKPFQDVVDALTSEANVKVLTQTVGQQKVRVVEGGPVRWVGYVADGHAVMHVTTQPVAELLAAKGDRLTSNPLFKELTTFKEFPTHTRFFLDVPSIVKVAKSVGLNEVQSVIDALGIDGVQSVRYWGGYDGLAQRDRLDVATNGPRKGLLSLWNGKPFSLKDLPALPPSLTGFSVGTLDGGHTYDTLLEIVTKLTQTFAPNEVAQINQGIKHAEDVLGFKVRDDFLAHFKGIYAGYAAENEGIFGLGGTLAVQVTDSAKLQKTLESLAAKAAQLSGKDVSITKKPYRTATLYEVRAKVEGMIFAPTYTIHKGYFVFSLYPQAVTGYIARADGALPAWTPEPALQASLERLPKSFVGLQVNDPRPSVQTLFTLLPLGAGAARGFVPNFEFDLSTIPNVQAVNHHLFPNVIVTTDDGKLIRDERLTSADLPPLGNAYGVFVALGAITSLGERAGAFPRGIPAPEAPRPIEAKKELEKKPVEKQPEQKKEFKKDEPKRDEKKEFKKDDSPKDKKDPKHKD